MQKLYVAIGYTDDDGFHKIGDQVELPDTTDEDKANIERAIEHGILSKSKPDDAEREHASRA